MSSLKSLLFASVAVLVVAPPALAQSTPAASTGAQSQPQNPDPTKQDSSTQVTEVVVTGSRIARPNLDQPTPVSTLSPQQIQNSGTANLADIIAQLPRGWIWRNLAQQL